MWTVYYIDLCYGQDVWSEVVHEGRRHRRQEEERDVVHQKATRGGRLVGARASGGRSFKANRRSAGGGAV